MVDEGSVTESVRNAYWEMKGECNTRPSIFICNRKTVRQLTTAEQRFSALPEIKMGHNPNMQVYSCQVWVDERFDTPVFIGGANE
jgi:hypothetical protein